ncbi:hypothetical protein Q9Q94_15190 [Uliginosibacterium sp. 31-16]|uniref:hypothetical protein n=1 Tax=Uliginosibacterium sp. 31-16 TaxID=3068315 RepID=UPI00273D455E|nr:hypothetical protein [Uliginosibacterium sp. 31-16]MDP5240885.1 hypothetical protein [Uliginosibacterium sp. 31-16]
MMPRVHFSIVRYLPLLICTLAPGCTSPQSVAAQKWKDQFAKGEALFKEKCSSVAGMKIYRTVENVDGLLLLKVRGTPGEREWRDPMWPSAAFENEYGGETYIKSFLSQEHAPGNADGTPGAITPQYRGYLNTARRPTGRPGYLFVDVIDERDGTRYRYKGRWEEPWQYDKSYLKGYIKFFLDKAVAPEPAPRYAVTYEEYVVPEERALWVAGGKVSVIDLAKNEVLGEMIQYKHSWGGISPWLRGPICPGFGGTSDGYTRKFVDQVLIPVGR